MTPQERAMAALNAAAFDSFDSYDDDNYDPEINDYDPDNATGMQVVRPRPAGSIVKSSPRRTISGKPAPTAQFDITITNNQSTTCAIELFNAQNSISEFTNNTTNSGLVPALSARGINVRNSAGTGMESLLVYGIGFDNATGTGTLISAYWDEFGDLIYTDVAGDTCVISCKQIPYRSLFKYSERGSFRIDRMRMKFTTSNQINQDLTITQKTFLGLTKSNIVSPSSYFSPQQYQSLILDIPVPISIDAERGIQTRIVSGETLLINMFVSNYSRSAI